MLEKGNYIPWESRFKRFLDNKLEDGERMWNLIQNGPYQKPMIVDLTNPTVHILEPLSKMTEGHKKQYIADVRVMNYLLQAIPNDIYNSVDALTLWNHNVLASRAKKAAKNHDPLALIAHLNASSHISCKLLLITPNPYDVSNPPTNRRGNSSNTRNQAVVQDGRVDIQTKNAGYGGNANKNAGRNRTQGFNTGNAGDESNQIIQRVPRNESTPGKENVQCYNCNEKGHYARECQKEKVHDAKYFREQMLLAMKDEAGSNLSNEENDFMLDTSYGEDLEELTIAVMLMARLQPADENAETVPSYDAKAVSQLEKKAFKEREDWYLDDMLDLEEKLSSHDRIVYKMEETLEDAEEIETK
ncbi:integrase, catalytic region, zinc finger, CCHC-type containing protein [Tanacetum coccineum]